MGLAFPVWWWGAFGIELLMFCVWKQNYFNLFPLLNIHPLPPLISGIGNTTEMKKGALRAFGCSWVWVTLGDPSPNWQVTVWGLYVLTGSQRLRHGIIKPSVPTGESSNEVQRLQKAHGTSQCTRLLWQLKMPWESGLWIDLKVLFL